MEVRERICKLVDKNSFIEKDSELSKSVITGIASIGNQQICIFAQDSTVKGGSLGVNHSKRIISILSFAIEHKIPIIGLHNSGGARIQEGVAALGGYGEIFRLNVLAKGKIPQIAVILGSCAGGASYSPALMDFVFTVDGISKMFVNGPKVIADYSGQVVDAECLGGADVLSSVSGNAHFFAESEDECFSQISKLLNFIPHFSCNICSKKSSYKNPFYNISVTNFSVTNLLNSVCDESDYLEVKQKFAKNVTTVFSRIGGFVVGIVVNNPDYYEGRIDIDAADKISEFVDYCSDFYIPIITFQQVPGFLCSLEQEHSGLIRHGAKIISSYVKSKSKKITVILKESLGGAYVALGSCHLGADRVFAWQNSKIAVMPASSAAEIIYHKHLSDNDFMKCKIEELTEKSNSENALNLGFVDQIIDPQNTREILIETLNKLINN